MRAIYRKSNQMTTNALVHEREETIQKLKDYGMNHGFAALGQSSIEVLWIS
jgi:hypothetical protein